LREWDLNRRIVLSLGWLCKCSVLPLWSANTRCGLSLCCLSVDLIATFRCLMWWPVEEAIHWAMMGPFPRDNIEDMVISLFPATGARGPHLSASSNSASKSDVTFRDECPAVAIAQPSWA
jgi:hypothetical protein